MKSHYQFVAFFSLFLAFQTMSVRAEQEPYVRSHSVVFNSKGQVSGPVLLIKAYQALVGKNVTSLLSVLNVEHSPINQSLIIKLDNKEIKIRLIHIAVLTKDPIMIGLLINLGARVGSKDSEGRNAAHYAAFGATELSQLFDYDPERDFDIASAILGFLHTQKVDLNERDRWLRSPLHYAANNGHPSIVSMLISLGVNLDLTDIYSFTPRQLAIRSGLRLSSAQLLANAGSESKLAWLDIITGVKNKAKSFAISYPFLVAGGAIATVAGVMATVIPQYSSNRAPTFIADAPIADDDEESDEPKLALPKSPLVIPGGSLGLNLVAPPPSNKLAKLNRAPPKKSATQIRLEDTTHALNNARRSMTLEDIHAGLQNAETLLDELEGTTLNEECKSNRKHLVAAINAITKLKALTPQISQTSKRILGKYDKYRKR